LYHIIDCDIIVEVQKKHFIPPRVAREDAVGEIIDNRHSISYCLFTWVLLAR